MKLEKMLRGFNAEIEGQVLIAARNLERTQRNQEEREKSFEKLVMGFCCQEIFPHLIDAVRSGRKTSSISWGFSDVVKCRTHEFYWSWHDPESLGELGIFTLTGVLSAVVFNFQQQGVERGLKVVFTVNEICYRLDFSWD